MRTRPVLLVALAVAGLAAPTALAGTTVSAPATYTDPAGDANGVSGQGFTSTGPLAGDNATPAGSQGYADVVSVTWAPDVKNKKLVGFTVAATFSAPPVAPAGTSLVYRMLGEIGDHTTFLGPVYYTSQGDPSTPQSALRANLTGTVRLTPIDLPKVDGSTMTWKVPVTALPKELKAGTTLTNLYFEVREIESFGGQKVPDGVPAAGGSTGLAYGLLDSGSSTASYKVS